MNSLAGLKCSFCNKPSEEVAKLISSPEDKKVRAYICDECVDVCIGLIEEDKKPKTRLLFGFEMSNLERMESGLIVTNDTIRGLLDCSLVDFLLQLKNLLASGQTKLNRVDRDELGQQFQKLEKEVRLETENLEKKKTELEALKIRMEKLTKALSK